MSNRDRFVAIYGPRNGSSMSVAQWDVRSQVWDKAFQAGRESMRAEARSAHAGCMTDDEKVADSIRFCIGLIKDLP